MPLDRRFNAYRPDLADETLRGEVDAPAYSTGRPACVAAPSVPVRSAPRPGASLDTELLFGERVTVFDQRDGWAWIKSETDDYVGYVPNAGLQEASGAERPTHRVAALRTFLFSRPDLKVPPEAALHHGSLLTVAGVAGDYLELASGGFVYAAHTRPLAEPDRSPVETARLYMDAPYLWGGRSSLGLDCSALVQLAWQACGVPCPRDSDVQFRAFGTDLNYTGPETKLRHGDLVFWKGHVGIFLDGGSLLHANASDMCVAVRPFAETVDRIAAKGEGPVIGARRPPMPATV